MNKRIYCYQIINRNSGNPYILKRLNSSNLPLTRTSLFKTYTEAKTNLRATIQRDIDALLEIKRKLLLQTKEDLDFKPMTDIADDRKLTPGHDDGWDKEQY
jgi:hypothetical protein